MYTGAVGLYSRFVHWLMERPFRRGRFNLVVEVGAGAGQHARSVRSWCGRYVESDVDSSLVGMHSRTTKGGAHVERMTLDAQDLSIFADDSVDRLIATCLLAHLDAPEMALTEWRRVMRDGGFVSVYVPCEPGWLLRTVRRIVMVPKARKFGQDHLATIYRDHRNHYPGMRAMMEGVFAGDVIRRVRFPFAFLGWNLSLFEVWQVRVVKR